MHLLLYVCIVYSDEAGGSANVLIEMSRRSRVVELLILHVQVCLSVCLSVCLCVCLSMWGVSWKLARDAASYKRPLLSYTMSMSVCLCVSSMACAI